MKKRKICADELPTGAVKPKKKRENPVDKSQVKTGIACKYCEKVCLNEETLSIHVNSEHADRQPMFQCACFGLRLNEFRLYTKHLGSTVTKHISVTSAASYLTTLAYLENK